MDYTEYLKKKDVEFLISEEANYKTQDGGGLIPSDKFREMIQKEVQLALKKLLEVKE